MIRTCSILLRCFRTRSRDSSSRSLSLWQTAGWRENARQLTSGELCASPLLSREFSRWVTWYLPADKPPTNSSIASRDSFSSSIFVLLWRLRSPPLIGWGAQSECGVASSRTSGNFAEIPLKSLRTWIRGIVRRMKYRDAHHLLSLSLSFSLFPSSLTNVATRCANTR